MSVWSRVTQFEKLSRSESQEDDQKDRKNETQKRKRFRPPGSRTQLRDPEPPLMIGSRVKPSGGVSDFEADLQEVWSVRRNIHHTARTRKALSNISATAAQYSRHGAIPAQHPQGPMSLAQVLTNSIKDCKPSETPWNVRTSNFSYSVAAPKRPMESSPVPKEKEDGSPPKAKRRPHVDGDVRPTYDERLHAYPPKKHKDPSEKVVYAQKMAKGYLKSVGSGGYTPKAPAYPKEGSKRQRSPAKPHEDHEQDEFDF